MPYLVHSAGDRREMLEGARAGGVRRMGLKHLRGTILLGPRAHTGRAARPHGRVTMAMTHGSAPSFFETVNIYFERAAALCDYPRGLLEQIKVQANKRDVPYQSLIKMWLSEKVDSK